MFYEVEKKFPKFRKKNPKTKKILTEKEPLFRENGEFGKETFPSIRV